MPYSVVDDLLIGDVRIGTRTDPDKYIQQAADEIDSKLGFVYKLPLKLREDISPRPDPDDWTGLPEHQRLLLKSINNRLASGSMILALDMSGEATALHAYGASLVREARADLMCLANGDVLLEADQVITSVGGQDHGPRIVNHDSESAVSAFERTVLTQKPQQPWWWQPGSLT